MADVTAECEVASITAPTATDNCGGTITATTDAIFPITAQGTTVVTWTYDDGNGLSTNFGDVPGFHESANRQYVAIASNSHTSQTNNPDLIAAAAYLSNVTGCSYTAGTYGLRLSGSQQTPGYQNNDQPHACLNNFVGTNDFYQRTTNGYTYIFATSDNAMGGLNTAIANGPGNTITQTHRM